MRGRWVHTPPPELGESFEDAKFTQKTLPPNRIPEPIDVAVRFSDGALFGLNTRNLFSGGRHDIFEITGSSFRAHVQIRGEGGIDVESVWEWQGGDFYLTPVSKS